MKIVILLFIFFLLPFGCKSQKNIEFCEGVSTEGAGVNCGEKFSTGDLTALIRSELPFGIDKLIVNIYKKEKYKQEKVDSLIIEVNPVESNAKTNLYFYDEGDFTVEVIGQDNKKIAKADIRIFDEF